MIKPELSLLCEIEVQLGPVINHTICIGSGVRKASAVHISIYAVS